MTKSQLIETIAQKAPQVPRRTLEAIVNAVYDCMVDSLRRGERIEIRGFGSFAVKMRRPREGRNPKTGQKVSVPSRRTLSFTVGKELRDRINPNGTAVSTPPNRAKEVSAAVVPQTSTVGMQSSVSEPGSAPAMAAAPPSRW